MVNIRLSSKYSPVNIFHHGRYKKTKSTVTGYSHYNKSQHIVEIEGGYTDD